MRCFGFLGNCDPYRILSEGGGRFIVAIPVEPILAKILNAQRMILL